MNIINSLRDYIEEPFLRITYLNNSLDIVNYKSIEHFDNYKILVKTDSSLIEVEGTNLVVSKLLKDEILINGSIKKIEFR